MLTPVLAVLVLGSLLAAPPAAAQEGHVAEDQFRS